MLQQAPTCVSTGNGSIHDSQDFSFSSAPQSKICSRFILHVNHQVSSAFMCRFQPPRFALLVHSLPVCKDCDVSVPYGQPTYIICVTNNIVKRLWWLLIRLISCDNAPKCPPGGQVRWKSEAREKGLQGLL